MAPILELKGFHYFYGNIEAVKGIDLYVDEGELVTLIGANGAGKTTTLQTISGLTSPSGVRGEIWFEGKRIDKKKGEKIAAMGLAHVLEGRHVFSQLTVEENLRMGAYLRNNSAEVKEDLKKVYDLFPRLLERRTQFAGTLSGGEQQMVAIGRAMMTRPKMILLDEPSLRLAPIIVKNIFEAIVEINKQGTTILFVEQNSKIALDKANRGYVMQNGKIIMSDYCSNLAADDNVRKVYLGIKNR